ncbi:centriolar and ciliogenesis-associated protein HYLS1 [Eublepharis macularius]|uniref:Centriolar and ciliogenesis-associated protein HYLS1 n=1 Tax=Eublepharis macularius TaxID=481883 RepID=A0AA97LFZ2_EUBMA|nr:centriolar and ciliogenesis-associated protein HYLS1 [Eublepharis macularius]XP_054853847.1 centriolar and ciliogenesis-associated protein HYLS1 [Eublepharis macularius]
MGPDQDQRITMNYEDRLKAAMAFIRLCVEHGGGDSPRQGHVPPYTAASVTRPMLPMMLKPTLQPEISEEPRVPRKPVMKRKVLRRRPDGEIQVTDESITSEPESSSLSDPEYGDLSQRTLHQNTKEDEESEEECEPKTSPESETAYSWRTSEDSHSQGSQRESRCQSSPSSEQDLIITGHPKSFILPRSEQLNQNRMKTDRVARYLEYKHDWESLRLPGEDSRKNVRRNIREQMLYKTEFPPRSQHTYIPNKYLVPTEKKRSALRWGIRCDLANGVMPRSSYSS